MRAVLALPALLLLLAACGASSSDTGHDTGERAGGPAASATAPTLDQAFPGRDPSLAWDQDGVLHVAYIEDREGGPRLMHRRLDRPAAAVAVSPPGVAIAARGEEPPLLRVLPDGTLVAAYVVSLPGRWKQEVRIQRSGDGGATWSSPAILPAHGEPASQSHADGAVAADGSLILSWLDKRDGQRGVRTASSRDGVVWTGERTVDGEACECCCTAVFAGQRAAWVAYRDQVADIRDMALARVDGDAGPNGGELRPARISADGWKLRACPDTGPRLAEPADGALWAAWFTGAEPGVYVAVSRDGGATFGPRKRVAAPGGEITAVAHPEIGVLPDGRLAVLYEAVRPGRGRSLEARLAQPENGVWSQPVSLAEEAVYPRLATRGPRSALAFTHRKGEGTEVVVRDGARLFP